MENGHIEALGITTRDTLVQGIQVTDKRPYADMGLIRDLTAVDDWVGRDPKQDMDPKYEPETAHASYGVALPVSLSITAPLFTEISPNIG